MQVYLSGDLAVSVPQTPGDRIDTDPLFHEQTGVSMAERVRRDAAPKDPPGVISQILVICIVFYVTAVFI